MAHVVTVPPIPGVKDFLTLCEFLNNREQAQQYIAQIEVVRGEINALVVAYGDVKDIDGLKIQAQDDRQSAAEYLAQAQQTAKDADERTQRQLVDANTRAQAVFEEAKAFKAKFERDARERTAQLDTRATTLDAREQALSNRERDASALMTKAQELHDEFSGKASRLKEALA